MFYQEKTKMKSFLNNFPKSVHFYGLTAIQVYFSRPSMTHIYMRGPNGLQHTPKSVKIRPPSNTAFGSVLPEITYFTSK